MARGSAEWGLPDWQDANAYEPPNPPLLRVWWWWQFMRRNRALRIAWKNHDTEIIRKLAGSELNDPHKSNWKIFPNWLTKDTLQIPTYKGKECLPDSDIISPAQLMEYMGNLPETINNNKYAVSIDFDYSEPINEQIERVKKTLDFLQHHFQLEPKKKRSRSHRAKWPVYLRVVDARDAGATLGEIAQTLFDEPDTRRLMQWSDVPDEARISQIENQTRRLIDKPPV